MYKYVLMKLCVSINTLHIREKTWKRIHSELIIVVIFEKESGDERDINFKAFKCFQIKIYSYII